MLKKLGIVSVGVTAGLMAAAPFASATESDGADCSHVAPAGQSNIGIVDCNHFAEDNGAGNTLNDVELPPPPPLPDLQELAGQLPELGGFANGLPAQIAIP